jgi:hypothetical protein
VVTRRALRRRGRGERGAAVFIVVMVIALLTAIGLVAAHNASLVDTASGYDRQLLQTSYLADYAGMVGTAEFGANPQTYLSLMLQGSEQCPSNGSLTPITTGAPVPCYKLFMDELSQRIATNFSGQTLLDQQDVSTDGSLGPPLGVGTDMMNGVFMVEMIEAYDSDPKAGSDVGGTSTAFHDVQVTMTATAQIRSMPTSSANGDAWCADTSTSTSASVQAIRAHVTLPNLPPI